MAISVNDFEWIFVEIGNRLKDAPGLYVSHVLHVIKDERERAFKVLIATLISLRTKEATTWRVSENVFKHIRSFEDIMDMDEQTLSELLYPCGFYKQKARQIKQLTSIIMSRHKGVVPDDLDVLLSLPGVGRKTANLVLIEAYDVDGICVDTHVHRILNRWGIVSTRTPDETEFRLRDILPQKHWKTINQYLVLFGQNICKPVSPLCNDCFLRDKCEWKP